MKRKAIEYFDTLPVEGGRCGALLCREMGSRFGDNETGLSLRSKLYQVAQKGGSLRRIWGTGMMYSGEGIFFLGNSRGRVICSIVLSQRTRKQEDFPGSRLGKEF